MCWWGYLISNCSWDSTIWPLILLVFGELALGMLQKSQCPSIWAEEHGFETFPKRELCLLCQLAQTKCTMSMEASDFLLGVWNSVEDAYMMNPQKYSGLKWASLSRHKRVTASHWRMESTLSLVPHKKGSTENLHMDSYRSSLTCLFSLLIWLCILTVCVAITNLSHEYNHMLSLMGPPSKVLKIMWSWGLSKQNKNNKK